MSGTVLAGMDNEQLRGDQVGYTFADNEWLWVPGTDQFFILANGAWSLWMGLRGTMDLMRSHLVCYLSGIGVEVSPIEEDPLEDPMQDPQEQSELGTLDYGDVPDLGIEIPISNPYATPDEGIVGTGYHYSHVGKRINWDVEF